MMRLMERILPADGDYKKQARVSDGSLLSRHCLSAPGNIAILKYYCGQLCAALAVFKLNRRGDFVGCVTKFTIMAPSRPTEV